MPKLDGSFGFDRHDCKSNPRSHDPICKFRNGDNETRKFKSITKLGVGGAMSAAVLLGDCPVGLSLRCFAKPISIEVIFAPVSKCAIARIDETDVLSGGPLNMAAVEISTGILNLSGLIECCQNPLSAGYPYPSATAG
jgi:hypothetical protein